MTRPAARPRLAALSCLLLALAGCAGAPPLRPAVDVRASENGIVVHDLRPKDESARQLFGLLMTSESYGILRLGDMGMEPSPVRLLQQRVHQARAGMDTVHLTVNHLAVYLNQRRALFATAMQEPPPPPFDAMGAVEPGGLPAIQTLEDPARLALLTGSSEYLRGVCTPDENPAGSSVIVVWMDIAIDGDRLVTRSVTPLQVEAGRIPYVEALEAAFRFALKRR